jgi:hypothetical protein
LFWGIGLGFGLGLEAQVLGLGLEAQVLGLGTQVLVNIIVFTYIWLQMRF